jgi:hypothetical protein
VCPEIPSAAAWRRLSESLRVSRAAMFDHQRGRVWRGERCDQGAPLCLVRT